MDLSARITRLPTAFNTDRGDETASLLPQAAGDLAKLLAGAGGSSPYIRSLVEKEADWLWPALHGPETAVADQFAALDNCGASELAVALRQAKRRIALVTALADLAGVWSLEIVTKTLSDFADLCCELALRAALAPEIKRGKLPGMTEANLHSGAGMVVLAMGKMGAGELNYSSDIDLICLFDESQFDEDAYADARGAFVRATKRMVAMLSDLTSDGYVFRTDLRLRPDPGVTPVCVAMAGAESYYESQGRTWERAAYIKARAAAGDRDAGARFLQSLRPFVWRRHLDFAAIQDAHDMRLRIRSHKGLHGPITLPGHNMKLGRGGIREIEFFTQTRQLISGGRDSALRARGTVAALKLLTEKKWVTRDEAQKLTAHYKEHREVEHRLQMINDAQTHSLPNAEPAFQQLACLMGQDYGQLQRDLMHRLCEVNDLTEGFFAPDAPVLSDIEMDSFDVTERWQHYPALRSERALAIFGRLKPEITARLQTAAKPREALMAFDGFLAGLPAGVQLFSMFEANPQLIDLLIDVVTAAPALGRHLSRNARVFDAVIGGGFFSDWPGTLGLEAELADILAAEHDYEKMLEAARRWGKEWHFRVGVHLLRSLIDPVRAGQQYADLAGATVRALWPVVLKKFSQKHGGPPGRGAVVLGIGSLGAGRLNATSDLDLIVIYDADGAGASDGRRPLPARTYYARLTQSLVTAITAPMAEGRVYEVDMRLRPSGNQGPVATSWQSFQVYQRDEAWVWEHLALTRARVIVGPPALTHDVEAFRRSLLGQDRKRAFILREVADMRQRIAAAKMSKGPLDAKIGPGRMLDVELISQAGALLAGVAARDVDAGLRGAVAIGWLGDADLTALKQVYDLCWQVQLASKLVYEQPLDPSVLGQAGVRFLLRATGIDDVTKLQEQLDSLSTQAADRILKALQTPREDSP
jgi:glutamate-ammonia-ligase adenylyltransferase